MGKRHPGHPGCCAHVGSLDLLCVHDEQGGGEGGLVFPWFGGPDLTVDSTIFELWVALRASQARHPAHARRRAIDRDILPPRLPRKEPRRYQQPDYHPRSHH